MENIETLDRRSTILDAALKVFLAYGFKRTTMADIADAVGISRPALYLEFKNKADIYRAGFIDMLEKKSKEIEATLERDGPLVDRLISALDIGVVMPMREVAQAPHGREILEMKQELAEDIGDDWNTVIERSLERTFRKAVMSGELDLSQVNVTTKDLARLMVMSVDGLKKRMCNWEQMAADFRMLITLMIAPLIRKS